MKTSYFYTYAPDAMTNRSQTLHRLPNRARLIVFTGIDSSFLFECLTDAIETSKDRYKNADCRGLRWRSTELLERYVLIQTKSSRTPRTDGRPSLRRVRRVSFHGTCLAEPYRSAGKFPRLLSRKMCVARSAVPAAYPSTLTILPTKSGAE
jgi:hypothetical protein